LGAVAAKGGRTRRRGGENVGLQEKVKKTNETFRGKGAAYTRTCKSPIAREAEQGSKDGKKSKEAKEGRERRVYHGS